jgi:pyruvate dehydrogenase E2 component (dihydrolipoamide acetyltransferase)
MSTTIEVCVPDIGDFKDIPVIEMLVGPGDLVKEEQPVITLESDKATLDIPTPVAGRVSSLAVAPGTRVSRGSLILTLEPDSGAQPPKTSPPQAQARGRSGPEVTSAREGPGPEVTSVPGAAREPVDEAPPDAPNRGLADASSRAAELASGRIYASPSIRRLGRELGVNLAIVAGSGRGGRIVIEDVYKSVREESPAPSRSTLGVAERAASAVDFSKFGEIERQPLSRIRRISGTALTRNWATIPHVTNFDEADITDLEAFRVKLNQELAGNPKLTLLPFLVKAIAATLRFAPAFNASLNGEDLITKKYVNVGVAVDTPGGLVVPVIRGAGGLGIIDIARELSSKAAAAQAGKLKAADFEGGCFTISSLGGVGGTGFTPIINAPEIAILGVAKAAIKPRYEGGQFLPRLILPLALSWDHRATDGVAAARFLVHLVALLEDFRRLSL